VTCPATWAVGDGHRQCTEGCFDGLGLFQCRWNGKGGRAAREKKVGGDEEGSLGRGRGYGREGARNRNETCRAAAHWQPVHSEGAASPPHDARLGTVGQAASEKRAGRLMAAAQELRNRSIIIRYCCPSVEPCMQTWLHLSASFRRLHDPSSRALLLRPSPDFIEVQRTSYFAAACAPLHYLESSLAVLGANYARRIGFHGAW
jgi:hypothetical protein